MRKNRIQCPNKDRLFSTPKNFELVRYGTRKDIDYKVSKNAEGTFLIEVLGREPELKTSWKETTKIIRAIGIAPKTKESV